jgi:signal transduction histidine kinase
MTERNAQGGLDAFLVMVGHELRQPLAPILTALEIMRQRPSREAGERARRTIERQIWQLSRFVDDLLDYANAQQGVLALRREATDLRTVLDAALETVQPLLTHREQTVKLSLPDRGLALWADPARLTQVFANLLSNMARLTEPGSEIAVDVTGRDAELVIRVRDTSGGISVDRLREIFNYFVNVEQEKSWPNRGVGLAVVRTLVDLHGGTVEAIQPRDDAGAEFLVVLPTQATAYSASPPVLPQSRSEPDQPSS